MVEAMTNEALALSIKEGQSDLIDVLWSNVSQLIYMKAKQFYHSKYSLCISRGVTIDDLYQVGYFALLQAVEYYSEDSKHKFCTYLSYPLRIQFNTLTGTNRAKSLHDPFYSALALDRPVSDEEDLALKDVIPDKTAEQAYKCVVDKIYHKELRSALFKGLESLKPIAVDIIHDYYFCGYTFRDLAKKYDISPARAKARVDDSFSKIRKSKHAQILREYL